MISVIQIYMPTATAGVVFNEREITIKAAPIIKYMKGWHVNKVISYCNKRNWRYEVTEHEARQSG